MGVGCNAPKTISTSRNNQLNRHKHQGSAREFVTSSTHRDTNQKMSTKKSVLDHSMRSINEII